MLKVSGRQVPVAVIISTRQHVLPLYTLKGFPLILGGLFDLTLAPAAQPSPHYVDFYACVAHKCRAFIALWLLITVVITVCGHQ